MHILLVTAAPPGSDFGSETTAIRWENLLDELGHETEQTYTYDRFEETHADPAFDAMVAIGAKECDDAITTFLAEDDSRPLILALNNADLYRGVETEPEVREHIDQATRVVVFHDRAPAEVPADYRDKVRIVYPGVELPEGGLDAFEMPPHRREKETRPYRFEVCVANNLQEHDDPIRAAKAAAILGDDSQVRVAHIGRILDARWETQVRRESENNDRYEWYGEVPWERALQHIRHADLLATTPSRGGASPVVPEAIALETPVVASHLPGNIGLLGEDYPGLFKPKDERDLAKRLDGAEKNNRYYNELQARCREKRALFDLDRERDAWEDLIDEIE